MASSFSGVTSFIVLAFLCVAVHVAYGTDQENNRPVMFIFGDSTADVGTNNFLKTRAKANAPYYGIDFPNRVPTGRFSNRFNIIDHIAQLFGYKESPLPYLFLRHHQYAFNKTVLGGVNFASGGSGILRDTGKQNFGKVVPLEQQVEQFAVVRATIADKLGTNQTATFLSKALFIISVGGNDLFEFPSNKTATLAQKQYLSALQSNFSTQIMNLYESGARRFGIINVAAIGFCPAVRANNSGESDDGLNQFAAAFNFETASLLEKLSNDLRDFKYSFGNSFLMTLEVLQNPRLVGVKETKKACCGVGRFNGEGPCLKAKKAELCVDRGDFLFWDWVHPTDKASRSAAASLFNGTSPVVTPINFRQLADQI
ncbi:hypothetical protein QN277_004652 [Acacia crassicarpa]|uniref:GDSL esterase/lipase n=1 Tax=Acacia crassicarpa TaxID=499986 RepID=A0AAE1J4U1_9FABA|nr:hypothetical protein QN277_004652 [Acacia crassicarpa]